MSEEYPIAADDPLHLFDHRICLMAYGPDPRGFVDELITEDAIGRAVPVGVTARNHQQITMDLSGLPTGLYVVTLHGQRQIRFLGRIIKVAD